MYLNICKKKGGGRENAIADEYLLKRETRLVFSDVYKMHVYIHVSCSCACGCEFISTYLSTCGMATSRSFMEEAERFQVSFLGMANSNPLDTGADFSHWIFSLEKGTMNEGINE